METSFIIVSIIGPLIVCISISKYVSDQVSA